MFKIEDYNNKKIVIHVKTQEEYDKLINLINTEYFDYWYVNKEKMCISIINNNWFYDSIDYYLKKEYQIVEFKDIIKFTKSDLQDTDIVTYRHGTKTLGTTIKLSENYIDDLIYEINSTWDIIKVERPTDLVTVYERKEKMSLDKALEVANSIKNNWTKNFNEVKEVLGILINAIDTSGKKVEVK